MQVLKALNWRYATKRFDPEARIKDSDLEKIQEVVRLSASSYGLQPYKVLIISNEELRRELRKHSWDQPQITDASHLLVFCNYSNIGDQAVDDIMNIRAKVLNKSPESLSGYGDFIKTKVGQKSRDEQSTWASKQAYIALANVLTACGELRIDACPIEGFEPEAYNSILSLEDKGLSATVVVAIGYRSKEDKGPVPRKIRRHQRDLFEIVT